MNENAKESIVEDINPQRGVDSEINRVLNKNKSLRESDSWDGATEKQRAEIRDRMTSTTSKRGLKYEKDGKTYIRVSKDNYKRVTSKKDVYIDKETDTVWLRDSKGRFKKVVK